MCVAVTICPFAWFTLRIAFSISVEEAACSSDTAAMLWMESVSLAMASSAPCNFCCVVSARSVVPASNSSVS